MLRAVGFTRVLLSAALLTFHPGKSRRKWNISVSLLGAEGSSLKRDPSGCSDRAGRAVPWVLSSVHWVPASRSPPIPTTSPFLSPPPPPAGCLPEAAAVSVASPHCPWTQDPGRLASSALSPWAPLSQKHFQEAGRVTWPRGKKQSYPLQGSGRAASACKAGSLAPCPGVSSCRTEARCC